MRVFNITFFVAFVKMSHLAGSNCGPTVYDTVALPTELRWQKEGLSHCDGKSGGEPFGYASELLRTHYSNGCFQAKDLAVKAESCLLFNEQSTEPLPRIELGTYSLPWSCSTN